MTKGEYVRNRMTKMFEIGHLRAHFGSFVFFGHQIEY
jgi:hypothetical protein